MSKKRYVFVPASGMHSACVEDTGGVEGEPCWYFGADDDTAKMFCDALNSARASALSEREGEVSAPEGHIIDDRGVVRKVLGTLPVLASGEMLGGTDSEAESEPLTVWARHPATGELFECHATPRWSELDDWRVRHKEEDADGNARVFRLSWCYSTRAAAESARLALTNGGAA